MRLFLIIIICILTYWRTLKYQGIIDDHDHIKTEKTPQFWKRIWEHFYSIKMTNLKLAHAFSILVHTLVCCLIYLVFGKTDVSLLAAIFFAINPVNNQGSMWLSGRVYAISTALFLLGMLFLPALPILYGLANWWSINTVLAPFLFILVKPHWLGLMLPFGLFLIRRKVKNSYDSGLIRYKGATDEMGKISFKKLIICLKTLGYYTSLCIFPFKLGMCHQYLGTFGLTDKETAEKYKPDMFMLVGLLVIGLVVFNLIYPFYSPMFGLFWFLLFSLQWLNFIVITHLISERYVYLSNIGLMWLLSNLTINTPFMWVFLTFYAVRLYYFMPAYKDYLSYWKSNTENFPNVAMGWNQYGLGLLQFGNTGSALDAWVRGVQERPNDFRLNFNTANLLLGSGMTKEAIRFIKTAEENLDLRNNYDFWKDKLNGLKEEAKKRGFEI